MQLHAHDILKARQKSLGQIATKPALPLTAREKSQGGVSFEAAPG